MQESLKKLPMELSAIYELILSRVRDVKVVEPEESGMRIIEIVLCSARRLRLDELQHALATKDDDNEFHEEGCFQQNEILARTGGLLIIEADQTVLFMHHTVDEFLNRPEVYDENFEKGHLRLARKCLAYASFKTFKGPCEEIEQLHERYRFLKYAVYRLGYHLSQCIVASSITVQEATAFLEKDVPLASLQVIATKILTIPSHDRMNALLQGSSTLHLAILWDIEPLVKFLVSEGANINAKGFKDATPIQIAARTLSASSTKFLIDGKADLSVVDVEGRTALDLILTRSWRDMTLRISNIQLMTFLLD